MAQHVVAQHVMDPSRAQVLDWLEAQLATRLPPADQADVLRVVKWDEDLTRELMEDFGIHFRVDISGFQQEWHQVGDRWTGEWPLPHVPYHGVVVPLSVTALHAASVQKTWPLIYPASNPCPDRSWLNLPLILLGLPLLTGILILTVRHIF